MFNYYDGTFPDEVRQPGQRRAALPSPTDEVRQDRRLSFLDGWGKTMMGSSHSHAPRIGPDSSRACRDAFSQGEAEARKHRDGD